MSLFNLSKEGKVKFFKKLSDRKNQILNENRLFETSILHQMKNKGIRKYFISITSKNILLNKVFSFLSQKY